jgi:hypothetical protein
MVSKYSQVRGSVTAAVTIVAVVDFKIFFTTVVLALLLGQPELSPFLYTTFL